MARPGRQWTSGPPSRRRAGAPPSTEGATRGLALALTLALVRATLARILTLPLALALARALAALDGRCDARRVQLLHQLAAVEDFVAFFEMMSTPAPLQLEPVDRPQP